jgi:hypothetical protein
LKKISLYLDQAPYVLAPSPFYAKGDPIFRVLRDGPQIFRGSQNLGGGGKVINTTTKKRHEHFLLRWLADAKKKVGVEQEKVSQVILDSA